MQSVMEPLAISIRYVGGGEELYDHDNEIRMSGRTLRTSPNTPA